MSDQELKPYPKGLLKTVAYTQLCKAIKSDFGIELPMKSGQETTFVIESMLGFRTPDPMLEELVGALEKLSVLGNEPLPGNSIGNVIAQDALKKYQQSKVQP